MNFPISPNRLTADWRRPAYISAIAATACLALAACGLQKGTNAGCSNGGVRHPSAGTSTIPGNAAKVCGPASIRARLDARTARMAAGLAILPLDFTNVSATTCRLSARRHL